VFMTNTDILTSKPALPAHRPRVFLAFLACFVWLVISTTGVLDWIPLPSDMRLLLGLFIPILSAMAILYPSDLFRKPQPSLRIGFLFLFSVVVLFCAFMLMSAFAVFLFAIGAVSPD
jgi:hypothetical protein